MYVCLCKTQTTDVTMSGIITQDTYDHLPVFMFLGKSTYKNKSPSIMT